MNEISLFIHGTTVGLNTLVQKKGSRAGLITTEGFTDVLEMARGDRKELYGYLWKKPQPLIPRHLRLGIKERSDHLGNIIKPVDKKELTEVIRKFRGNNVEAVAVCFLHAYANPDNELEAGGIIKEHWPGVDISLSHQVANEFREYERMSTTVLDAYIKKQVVQYLSRLGENIEKNRFSGQLLIVSPGGILGVNAIKEKTIAAFSSGPIGGVSGSAYISKLIGERNIVTMDVGGTSFDVSLIKDGTAVVRHLIDPDYFLGGEITLDLELARKGIGETAEKLGLSINDTADGILTIARNNMTTATKEILIGQGYDPRDFTLMSYVGAGGIFAAGIAMDMSISKIVIPLTPGVFSARGMLTMDIVHSFARTHNRTMNTVDISELDAIYQKMEKSGNDMLVEEQISENAIEFERSIDMCYEGQGHYVEVPILKEDLSGDSRAAISKRFHDLHEIRYGHQMDAVPKTINNRLKAIGRIKDIPIKESPETPEIPETAFKKKRKVYLKGSSGNWNILDRNKLLPGNSLQGPAIVEEPHHVTVVLPGQRLSLDKFGNLRITTGEEI